MVSFTVRRVVSRKPLHRPRRETSRREEGPPLAVLRPESSRAARGTALGVTDRSAAGESGFTLVEIVIAVAIVAATVAAGFGIALGSRSLAVSTAAGEFDQFLDSARTIARDLDGATLAFTPDAYGDGTEVRVLAGGPNGPPATTTLPVLHARAAISEVESLGKPPFAFIVHASGSLSGRPGYRVGDAATIDVGCPASGAFHFVFAAAGGTADRFVPCRAALGDGTATLTAWPLAPLLPSPTPCSGAGCTASSLPTVPASTASCPPGFTAIGGGCAPGLPPSSGAGARYHVTISGAPATITVGAGGSFTAQATLTNANAVPPGTPASVPVGIQSADTTCTATPSGWQPSGSAFTVTGSAAGTCTVTVAADASAVPGATTDTATVTITIAAAAGATPTPSPPQCDLVTNGKCYRRIVDRTTQTFNKTVSPDTACDLNQPDILCKYIDSIRSITLDEYLIIPPNPPIDDAHELLFRINRIDGLLYGCIPYSLFSSVPANDPLPLISTAVGGPTNLPIGFGNPSVNTTVNNVFVGGVPVAFNEKILSYRVRATLSDMIDSMKRLQPGLPYEFTFYTGDATPSTEIAWLPDFPSCDNAGDAISQSPEYGTVGARLSFEVFQAIPEVAP